MKKYEYRGEIYDDEEDVNQAIIDYLAPDMGDVVIEETKAFEDEWQWEVDVLEPKYAVLVVHKHTEAPIKECLDIDDVCAFIKMALEDFEDIPNWKVEFRVMKIEEDE